MSSASKMIVLKSSDGEIFEIDQAVAMQSVTIKHMIEDACADTVIPLSNVTSNILAKVIEYCKRHADAAAKKMSYEDLRSFDAKFVEVENHVLFHLILAANYLNIKSLLELTCQTVADMIKDKTPQQVREIFNIQYDFTSEEEDDLRRENAWALDGKVAFN